MRICNNDNCDNEVIGHHNKKYCTKECAKEKLNAYTILYRIANKDKRKKYRKIWDAENREERREYLRKYRENTRDGFWHLYYIKEEHYVGLTGVSLSVRGTKHRFHSMLIEDGLEEIASFEKKEDGLQAEKLLHSLGYNGSTKQGYIKMRKNQ